MADGPASRRPMRTVLVTGSDTGVGKTQVVAALARLLASDGSTVRILKPLETGAPPEGDAARARRLTDLQLPADTLFSFPSPIAPVAAAQEVGAELSLDELVAGVKAQPACDWRLIEGAGGIATPLDAMGRDWADFAAALQVDVLVVVVPDRLGAINQARLAMARAQASGCPAGIWLNAVKPLDAATAAANRRGIESSGLPVWAELDYESIEPHEPARAIAQMTAAFVAHPAPGQLPPRSRVVGPSLAAVPTSLANEAADKRQPYKQQEVSGLSGSDGCKAVWLERGLEELSERAAQGTLRALRVTDGCQVLNLADNDYLDLANDPSVIEAAAVAVHEHGTSASASPLITGWREPHASLIAALGQWHGFSCGLLWTSGYAANSAVLSVFPRRGDLVLADRLIHHSMIAGILRSGARLQRYEHLNLDQLEDMLGRAESGRSVFVVTESVFSMDGDYPNLALMAALKRRHGFCWVLDEAHAVGWYGPEGSGLARAANVAGDVDILVGTLGKTLASAGAYTLFHRDEARDFLVNVAGEFIYSTAMPPAAAVAAAAALDRVRSLAKEQPGWHAASRHFRALLREKNWSVPPGDSPIVPVQLDDPAAAVSLANALRAGGILAAAIRPPTVPPGTSRIRSSLKRTFGEKEASRVLEAMETWRARS